MFLNGINIFLEEGDKVEFDSLDGCVMSELEESIEKVRTVVQNDHCVTVRIIA